MDLITEKKMERDSRSCKGLCHILDSLPSGDKSLAFPGGCPLSPCPPWKLKPGLENQRLPISPGPQNLDDLLRVTNHPSHSEMETLYRAENFQY